MTTEVPPMTWGEAIWCWAGFLMVAIGLTAIHPALPMVVMGAFIFWAEFESYCERTETDTEETQP